MHHLPHLPPSCPSRSSQGTELSSLRSIGTSPQLSILHLIVYICGCHFFHLFTSFLPLVSTNPFSSLCLHCLPAISSLIPFSRFHKCVNIQYWFSLSDFTLYNRTNIYWAFFFVRNAPDEGLEWNKRKLSSNWEKDVLRGFKERHSPGLFAWGATVSSAKLREWYREQNYCLKTKLEENGWVYMPLILEVDL